VRPETPVVLGAREERRGRALTHELVGLAHLVVRLTRRQPEGERRAAVRGHLRLQHADAVDRALRHGVARELAVLRVAERPLLAGRVLLTDRERAQAEGVPARATGEEEIAAQLVMDDRLRARVVVRAVADTVPVEVCVELVEEAHFAILAGRVLDRDLFEVDVAVEVDCVPAIEAQLERGVIEMSVPDERLVLVIDAPLPAAIADPHERPVGPDSEAARLAGGVVLLTDVGVVEVAQLIVGVEGDEEVAVPEWEIARQWLAAPRGGEEALRVRGDAAQVAPLQQVRPDERAAYPESHHARFEVRRDLVVFDVAGRDERTMLECSAD